MFISYFGKSAVLRDVGFLSKKKGHYFKNNFTNLVSLDLHKQTGVRLVTVDLASYVFFKFLGDETHGTAIAVSLQTSATDGRDQPTTLVSLHSDMSLV